MPFLGAGDRAVSIKKNVKPGYSLAFCLADNEEQEFNMNIQAASSPAVSSIREMGNLLKTMANLQTQTQEKMLNYVVSEKVQATQSASKAAAIDLLA